MAKKTIKPELPVNDTELDDLKNQVNTLNDNWKRALADYQNLLKRMESEKKDYIKFVNINMISKLLPSLDILELAAMHSQDQGVSMAVKQFQQLLKDEGLQEIVPAIGDQYDHLLHECIEVIPSETEESVAEIVTKGYKIDDYVIRPAKVKVWQKS